MQTMNVVLSDSLNEYILNQIVQCGYENAGEYFSELVQADRLRKEKLALEAEVLRGLECQERIVMTDETWDTLYKEVQDRLLATSESSS